MMLPTFIDAVFEDYLNTDRVLLPHDDPLLSLPIVTQVDLERSSFARYLSSLPPFALE